MPNLRAEGELTTSEGERIIHYGTEEHDETIQDLAACFASIERLARSLKMGTVEQVVTYKALEDDGLVSVQKKIADKTSDNWLLSHVVANNFQDAFVASEFIEEQVTSSLNES